MLLGLGHAHMNHFVVRKIPPAPKGPFVEALCALGVATVHEAQGRSGLMRPAMRPLFDGALAAGRAVTVLAPPGDNWMIHVALELCEPGDMLVVGCISQSTDGMVGDLIATLMQAKGLAGLVIDAGCRDVRLIREMGLPIWSTAISAQGTVKASPGSVNVPVTCAGVHVCPGDIVLGDDDGVVVIPHARLDVVMEAARVRAAREEQARLRMAAGGPALGATAPMLAQLESLGVTWVDKLEQADSHE